MEAMLKRPVDSVSKTAMRVLPLTVVTPVMPSRDVISEPEIVRGALHVAPSSVEKRSRVSWS